MGLNFQDSLARNVDLGDITAARFLQAEAWTLLQFIRIENSDGDDRSIFSKQASPANTQTSIQIRTDAQTAPTNIECFVGLDFTTFEMVGGDVIELDTWYLVAITCSGAAATNDLKLYTVGMDGTFLDEVTGTHEGDPSTLTHPLKVAARFDGGDRMDGDIDYVAYIQKELSKDQVLAYLYNPVRTAMSFKADGVPFMLKLGHSGDNSVDLSGSKNHGTLNGNPLAGDSPPVAPLFGFDNVLPFAVVAGSSAALSGTSSDGLTETEIVNGGETIIIDLTNDTWVAAGGPFNGQRQNIIDGLDAADSQATGWNAEVRDKEVVGAVVRTSDTRVTITLSASASYDISTDETITVTAPATALVTSGDAVIATPTIGTTADVSGVSIPIAMYHYMHNTGSRL